MTPRPRTTLRYCAITLLVLVVSPVTAPFSTCDLHELLAGHKPHAGPVLDMKTAGTPVPALACRASVPQPPSTPAPEAGRAADPPRQRAVLSSPLRL